MVGDSQLESKRVFQMLEQRKIGHIIPWRRLKARDNPPDVLSVKDRIDVEGPGYLRCVYQRLKAMSESLNGRVNRGEEAVTTVVHIGEIANLLEDFMPLNTALRIVRGLLLKGNIHIAQITRQDYLSALPTAQESQVGLNDALAYTLCTRVKDAT